MHIASISAPFPITSPVIHNTKKYVFFKVFNISVLKVCSVNHLHCQYLLGTLKKCRFSVQTPG